MGGAGEVAALATRPANGSESVVLGLADVVFIGSSAIDAFMAAADTVRKLDRVVARHLGEMWTVVSGFWLSKNPGSS